MANTRTNKQKIIYKVVSSLTLILPVSITLLVSAIQTPTSDYHLEIDLATYETDNKKLELDNYIVNMLDSFNDNEAETTAFFEYNETKKGVAFIGENAVGKFVNSSNNNEKSPTLPQSVKSCVLNIKRVDSYDENAPEYKNAFDYIKLTLDKNNVVKVMKITSKNALGVVMELPTKTSLGLNVFVMIAGIAMIALIVSKKMNWTKENPQLAVFISLVAITLILLVISEIITTLLYVFMVATASWGAYYIEYLVYYKGESTTTEQKRHNDISDKLEKIALELAEKSK